MGDFGELFAGCGGLSLGLQRSGWKLRFAIEANQDAFSTYKTNIIDRPGVIVKWPEELPNSAHDIVAFLEHYSSTLVRLRGSLDILTGGPPCQGFSTNGRRCPDDPRNRLVTSYLKVVQMAEPTIVLMENVRGFASMPHSVGHTYLEFVRDQLEQMGYDTWSELLYASDWGVPQRRPRFFLIAVQKGLLLVSIHLSVSPRCDGHSWPNASCQSIVRYQRTSATRSNDSKQATHPGSRVWSSGLSLHRLRRPRHLLQLRYLHEGWIHRITKRYAYTAT